ncbi:calcium/calmodulin dependent protein kinase II Association-domain containing protein [Nitzschia inconspicua]|uniref:Calcium/calmodulin dependent protein kinase II Association-domain containing protein n=1 Tax=Nitzschia inconspicua TaxID=303405 RepID=A0A9K3LNP4_9STRA|nr:calcium/calmodulin dependent protein kinase II Association-domain containing protein [Nitzschia inconspicua]KAG7365663.1 calcium/calmodulin dependent protein kinase II Association-domain containing protein [Nitzschia inconspicua]
MLVAKFSRPAMQRMLQSTSSVAKQNAFRAGAAAMRPYGSLLNNTSNFEALSSVNGLTGLQTRSFFATAKVERSAPAISNGEVQSLFSLWNDALATLDPDTVAKRYAKTSVLLPTVSDEPRTDYNGIRSYFVDFLKKKPQGVILESNVIQGQDWCMDAGIYEFTMGATGDKVKARYTYVYTYEDGEWKIAHHHSSVMPEAFLG